MGSLLPREVDKLLLHAVGSLAQKRLARGLRLNLPEATGLLATVLHELARDGTHSVADLMSIGKTILGRRHVMPSVPAALHDVQIEAAFPDGTFLVTVHDPVCSDGVELDLSLALYSSFLPVPSRDLFPPVDGEAEREGGHEPGAVVVSSSSPTITINEGRERIRLHVVNHGDRPIQVGSHYHMSEVNRELSLDRRLALFKRLDIPAGTAVRFEPGESKAVTLVEIGGHKRIAGGNGLATGLKPTASAAERERWVREVERRGFRCVDEPLPSTTEHVEPYVMGRRSYAAMFGPTTGDCVRLADTSLWIEVEHDLTVYGDECKFGGGKVIRDGMGQASGRTDGETLDLVITNALIVDWSGIYKADIGVRKGIISAIGKSGNPDVQDGVTEGMVVGSNTEVIAGEKLIVTAGAIDAHVHFICKQLVDEALASGTTTLIGGGTGPSAGTNATTCTPSATYIQTMMHATDGMAVNIGLTGKGNDSGAIGIEEQVQAGVIGLKLHEDWGTTPAAIDTCMTVADKYDVQVNIHTDTLNESGFVEDTIAAFKGRTIHTYHSEGAGGGHAPDIIVVCGQENVLPSSTNPTRPYAKNTLDEHMDMLMVCHHLDRSLPEDVAFAESRIRAETIAAEDVLHDEGAISIISSDAQAMGRIGEVIARTWRTASKMRTERGPLPGADTESGNDNFRVKRYVAKYTINPAIAQGMSHVIGDVAKGKLADLVLWKPANFGIRPEMVIKGGVIAWAMMGDANASIPTVQPVLMRPMWGATAQVAALNSLLFVSQVSLTNGAIAEYKLKKRAVAVKNCRSVTKKDLKHNAALPKLTVDPETFRVESDGVHATVPAATTLPLTRNYALF